MAIENVNDVPGTTEEIEKRWPKIAAEMAVQAKSPAPSEQIIDLIKADEGFIKLINGWDKMDLASRSRGWVMVLDRIKEAIYSTRQYCIRCGECCKSGSPALYNQDRASIGKGAIRRQDLVTLRKGETAYSNKDQRYFVLEQERVKLKEVPEGRVCIFLGPGGDACLIYEDRPYQCHVLECWDPSRFETLLTTPALTRADLLGTDHALAEVMDSHDQRCDLDSFRKALNKIQADNPETQEDALEMILFDLHVREFVKEKFNLEDGELDFLFGRPLAVISIGYGYRLDQLPNGEPKLTKID